MKTKTSKKKFLVALSMALGVMIFTGAAFANYSTANGYEVGKTALKGLLKNENYTANAEMKIFVDENEVMSMSATELYDRNGAVSLNRESVERSYLKDEACFDKTYKQNGDDISIYTNSQGEEYSRIYHNNKHMGGGSLDALCDMDEKDLNTVQKFIRVGELAGDLLVGDLKNNVVYVSGDDNCKSYEVNLDSVQIPELINAGLSAIFSTMNSSDVNGMESPVAILGTDPIIKNVSIRFTVDAQGRLTDGHAAVTASGNSREARVEMSLKISDYGTTVPQALDISEMKFDHEYDMSNDRYHYVDDEDEEAEPEVEVEETKSVNVEYAPESGNAKSVAVIGGADGPTAIYVSGDGEENADRVDEDGNVTDSNGNKVGHIEINDSGEGVVVYDK